MKKIWIVTCCIVLLIPCLCVAAVTSPAPQGGRPKPSSGASLTITVSIEDSTGTQHPAQNLQVFLCRHEVAEQIREVRKTGNIIAQHSGPYRALLSDLTFLEGRAAQTSVATQTADQHGQCTFQHVQPGSYIVYAGYHDDTGAGYWAIPVTVKEKKKITVTLSRKNLTEYAQNK